MGPAVLREPVAIVRADGGRDELEHFAGADGQLLFGCRHHPAPSGRARAPIGGVVVCSPILTDFDANYRREVELARLLAARGVVVQRFHPRGVGQSDGDAADITLDSLISDVGAAAARLRLRCGIERPAILGTRFAALAAAAVSSSLGGAPLALWEPTVRPSTYVRAALRARAVHGLDATNRASPEDELARRGFLDVLGFPVGRELLETDAHRSLAALAGGQPRPVLLVAMERRDGLRAEYGELAAEWGERGFDVTVRPHPSGETWWFADDRLEPLDDLIGATADWVLGCLDGPTA